MRARKVVNDVASVVALLMFGIGVGTTMWFAWVFFVRRPAEPQPAPGWECLTGCGMNTLPEPRLDRLSVPGGWLLMGGGGVPVFYPDARHRWVVESPSGQVDRQTFSLPPTDDERGRYIDDDALGMVF